MPADDFNAENPQNGGAKRKTAAKKAAPATKKKVAAPKSGKKPSAAKKGGDVLSEQLTGLAVPFAFLLAKQGLEALKGSSDKKKTSQKPPSSRRRATLAGGACSTCQAAPVMLGGATHSLRNLEKLRKNIDSFLAKY